MVHVPAQRQLAGLVAVRIRAHPQVGAHGLLVAVGFRLRQRSGRRGGQAQRNGQEIWLHHHLVPQVLRRRSNSAA